MHWPKTAADWGGEGYTVERVTQNAATPVMASKMNTCMSWLAAGNGDGNGRTAKEKKGRNIRVGYIKL